ncbi:MAG: GDSL-type esterase/lipase family protein [Abditibacteriaceae bacterium]
MILKNFHHKIAESSQDNAKPPVVIAALGDSVTVGSGDDGDNLGEDVYHAQLQKLLETQYPQCKFRVINAGKDGQNAEGGLEELENLVLPHSPDLVLIGYGLNDAAGGELAGLPEFSQALETLISRTREATDADIILLTPNMMPHRDNDKIPDEWRHVTELFLRLQKDGILAAYAQCVRDVGAKNNVAVADVYAAWEELELRGVDTTAMLTNGLNHPDASGHLLTAKVLLQVILAQQN